jgi:hypothetical protein
LKSCAVQADDYEKTIVKFRQKTTDLQEEIQDLRDQVCIHKVEMNFKYDYLGIAC